MSSAIPNPPDDASLLADFVESVSEQAFRQIVDRHLGMVHAAAVRQVRDDSLADDVTQAVFTFLAKKANYTLHVWQEKLGEMEKPLKIEAGRGRVEFIYDVDNTK